MASPGNTLRVTFTADQAALVALLQHQARVSAAYHIVRRRNLCHAAMWGVVVTFAAGLLGYAQAPAADVALSRALQVAVICASAFGVFTALVLSRRGFYRFMDAMIRRRVARSAIEVEHGPFVVTLVDEGLVCESTCTSSLALWSEVARIVVEEAAVYIDLDNGQVYRVPREAFSTDVAFRRFVEFACARAGNSAHVNRPAAAHPEPVRG